MIPEPIDGGWTPAARATSRAAAGPARPAVDAHPDTGSDVDPGADPGADAAREMDELSFLVGTACSRTITLLMQSDFEPGALRDELRFLADKAARLAALLVEGEGEGHDPSQGP